jgi:hypothetical protein
LSSHRLHDEQKNRPDVCSIIGARSGSSQQSGFIWGSVMTGGIVPDPSSLASSSTIESNARLLTRVYPAPLIDTAPDARYSSSGCTSTGQSGSGTRTFMYRFWSAPNVVTSWDCQEHEQTCRS